MAKSLLSHNMRCFITLLLLLACQPTYAVSEVFGRDNDALNEIKSRFEGLFVNYQYLRGCEVVSDDSYHFLNSALMHELASNSAPARMQYDILTAAKGTYDEIYARSECDAASVEHIKVKFNAYIEDIKKIGFVIQD